MRPLNASRHTWAGTRAPSRTRSSMYHGGTGWVLGNHVNDFLTEATSMGSVGSFDLVSERGPSLQRAG